MYYGSGTVDILLVGSRWTLQHQQVHAVGAEQTFRHGHHLESVTSNQVSDSFNLVLVLIKKFLID